MLIAVDTSGPLCSAALLSLKGECLAFESVEIGRGHAEKLMPMIEDVMRKAAVSWEDVTRIAVTRGPGSFTGLRVGLSTARGLALARSIAAEGVSVFEAFAHQHMSNQTVAQFPFAVALDARRGEIWLQAFDASGEQTSEPMALSVEDAVTHISGGSSVTGSGGLVMQAAGANITVINEAASPDIVSVGLAALSKDRSQPASPLYLRAPDAKPQASAPLAKGL